MGIKQFTIACLLSLLSVSCHQIGQVATAGNKISEPEVAGECCQRNVATLKIPMPPEVAEEHQQDIALMWDGALLQHLPSVSKDEMRDCPLVVELAEPIERLSWTLDYVFEGTLSLDQVDSYDPGECEENEAGMVVCAPDLAVGQWTLQMRLVNANIPGDVVRQGEMTWYGTIDKVILPELIELAGQFMPLDEVLYDYERLPRDSQITAEKDQVACGETIAVDLSGVIDHLGRSGQSWQRLVVEVERGKISHSAGAPWPDNPEKRLALLVQDAQIPLQYTASESCECPQDSDTIRVYNSCEFGIEETGVPLSSTFKFEEIAQTELDILCCTKGYIDYDEQVRLVGPELAISGQFTGIIPFTVLANNGFSQVHGVGDIQGALSGSIADCYLETSFGMGPTRSVQIDGDRRTDSDQKVYLDLHWLESSTGNPSEVKLVCPDGAYYMQVPHLPSEHAGDMTFLCEEGQTVEAIVPGGVHFRFTLHLDNP